MRSRASGIPHASASAAASVAAPRSSIRASVAKQSSWSARMYVDVVRMERGPPRGDEDGLRHPGGREIRDQRDSGAVSGLTA